MMKVSTRTEYGLRCLLQLAREGKALAMSEIAQRERLPRHYTEQIMLRLRRGGLIKSIRGTQGGFTLSQPASEITMGAVLRVLEGAPFQDTCTNFNRRTDCGHLDGCSIRPVWQTLAKQLWDAMDRITLQQLVVDEKTVERKLALELPVLSSPDHS